MIGDNDCLVRSGRRFQASRSSIALLAEGLTARLELGKERGHGEGCWMLCMFRRGLTGLHSQGSRVDIVSWRS